MCGNDPWRYRGGEVERLAAGHEDVFVAVVVERFAGESAIDGQHADTPLPHTIHYSVSDNRVDITLDGGGTGSLWWATKNEWLGLLDVAGLRLEALYGGFAGESLDDNSHEYVFVARR